MRNVFLETIAEKTSSDKYVQFVKQNGKPGFLNEEIIIVGLQNFVPFINEVCTRSTCVYDLSQIEAIYSNRYDVSDDFKVNGDFDCHYCDENIKFGGFYTCQQLTDDVEVLFHQINAKKPMELKGEATPGLKRRTKRPRLTNIKKKGTLILFNDEQQDIPNQLIPLLAKKLNVTKTNNLVFDNSEFKEKLKAIKVPDFQEADFEAGWKFSEKVLESIPIDFELSTISKFSMGHLMDQMPTFEDIQDTLALHPIPLSVQKLLLIYWRVRYCKDRNKLLSIWLFEVVRKNGELKTLINCEKVANNSKMILNNIDSTSICLIVKFDISYIFMEYKKLGSKLIIYTFTSAKDDIPIQEKELARQSEIAEHYFEKINLDFFDSKLEIASKNVETIKLSCSICFALTHFVMIKYYNAEQQSLNNIDILMKWLIKELMIIRSLEPEAIDRKLSELEEKELSLQYKEGSIEKKDTPSIKLIPVEELESSVSRRNSILIKRHNIDENTLNPHTKNSLKASSTRKVSPIIKNKHPFFNRDLSVKVISRIDSVSQIAEFEESKVDIREKNNRTAEVNYKSETNVKKLGMDIMKFKHKPVPVIKLSKNNVIPDLSAKAASSKDDDDNNETGSKQLSQVKNLLSFYFENDKNRYQILSSKCKDKYGAGFFQKLGGSISKINFGSAPQSRKSIARPKEGSQFKRRQSAFSNQADDDGQIEGKEPKHGRTESIGSRYYMSRAFPSVMKSPTSEHATRNNTKSVHFKRHQGSLPKNDITISLKNSISRKVIFHPGSEVPPLSFDKALYFLEQDHLTRLASMKLNHLDKSFCFRTSFALDLIKDMNQEVYTINYKRVEHFTYKFTGKGHSIFDIHKRVIIPVCREVKGIVQYRVVVVENKGMKITIFDPQGTGLDSSMNKQCCRAVSKYVIKDLEVRSHMQIDKKAILLSTAESPADKDEAESGNWCLYYIGCMLRGDGPLLSSAEKKDKMMANITKQMSSP